MRCQPGDPPCIPELDSSQPFRCTHVIVPSLTKLVIFSGIIATYVVTVSTRATEQPVAVWAVIALDDVHSYDWLGLFSTKKPRFRAFLHPNFFLLGNHKNNVC